MLLVLVSALWFSGNAEFVETVNEQVADGYTWKYVGQREANPDVPHIDVEGKVYFVLEKE